MKIEEAIENLKEMIELHEDGCLITTEDDFQSIKILLNIVEEIKELIENNEEDIDYSIHDIFEDLKKILEGLNE